MRKFTEERPIDRIDLENQLFAIQDLASSPNEKALLKDVVDLLSKRGLNKLALIFGDFSKKLPKSGKDPSQEVFSHTAKKLTEFLSDLTKTAKQINAQVNQHNKGNAPVKQEVIQAINEHLLSLHKEAAQLIISHLKMVFDDVMKGKDSKESRQLAAALDKIDELTNSYFNGDLRDIPQVYLEECKEIMKQEIKPILQKQGNYWDKLAPAFKAFLGVLAAVTVIPALAIEAGSKKGYGKTFFETPPDKKIENTLEKLVEFDSKLNIKPHSKKQ